jgi:mannosyltransferase
LGGANSLSLWLDETVTYWIIEGGYAKIFARAAGPPGQSPIYYLVAWLAQLADGNNVAILRLPSLIAMIAAAWLLYKLAERLFDAETAPLATLVFVCSEQVAFEAADARPYALGLCLLTASCLMLVRWLDTGRPHYGAGYSLLIGLTIYAQIFLAIALVWHGVYALYRSRRGGLVTLPALIGAWVAAGLLCAPLFPRLLEDALSIRSDNPGAAHVSLCRGWESPPEYNFGYRCWLQRKPQNCRYDEGALRCAILICGDGP